MYKNISTKTTINKDPDGQEATTYFNTYHYDVLFTNEEIDSIDKISSGYKRDTFFIHINTLEINDDKEAIDKIVNEEAKEEAEKKKNEEGYKFVYIINKEEELIKVGGGKRIEAEFEMYKGDEYQGTKKCYINYYKDEEDRIFPYIEE